MAWDYEVIKAMPPNEYKPVDERFAALLSKVASGELDKEDAWRQWLEIQKHEGQE